MIHLLLAAHFYFLINFTILDAILVVEIAKSINYFIILDLIPFYYLIQNITSYYVLEMIN